MNLNCRPIFKISFIVFTLLFSQLVWSLPLDGVLESEKRKNQEIAELVEDEGRIEVQEDLVSPIRTVNLKSVQEQVLRQENNADEESTEN